MALSLRRLRVVRLEIGKGHLNHQSSPNCYLFEWPVWHVERAANLRKFHDPFWPFCVNQKMLTQLKTTNATSFGTTLTQTV